jgi:hypothetical protein
MNDEGITPAIHSSELFEITSHELPGDWSFNISSKSSWELSPTPLSGRGFWDLYFDGDLTAQNTLGRVLAKL